MEILELEIIITNNNRKGDLKMKNRNGQYEQQRKR